MSPTGNGPRRWWWAVAVLAMALALAPVEAQEGRTFLDLVNESYAVTDEGIVADPDGPQRRADEAIDNVQYNEHTAYDWAWGELLFGQTYQTVLVVTNKCESRETVKIDVERGLAPYLTILREALAPPGDTTIDVTITTPQAPEEPPFVPGSVGPPPPFERFVDIKGRLMLLEKGSLYADDCFGPIKLYTVSGHIHYYPEDPDHGDPCNVFWMSGRMPPPGQDCTDAFRGYAAHYIESLQPIIDAAPQEWNWLPSALQLVAMDQQALLAVKARAEQQRTGR